MTVLSKTSPIYLEEKRPKQYIVSIREAETGFFFSKDLGELLRMEADKTILFVETDKNWLFACDDYEDGFPLKINNDSKGFVIWDTALIRIFLRQTGHKTPCSFYVQKTDNNHRLKGKANIIMEILTNKSIEQIKKQT